MNIENNDCTIGFCPAAKPDGEYVPPTGMGFTSSEFADCDGVIPPEVPVEAQFSMPSCDQTCDGGQNVGVSDAVFDVLKGVGDCPNKK